MTDHSDALRRAAQSLLDDKVWPPRSRLLPSQRRTSRSSLRHEVSLLTHKLITCGVAASHPDAGLSRTGIYAGKWDSPQAEKVRDLRDEVERLRSLAAPSGETRDDERNGR